MIEASGIFTEEEKEEVDKGAEARVWIEISKTNEETNAAEDDAGDVTTPEDGGEDVTKPEEDEKDEVPKTGEGANTPLMWTLLLLLAAAIVAYGKKWQERHE